MSHHGKSTKSDHEHDSVKEKDRLQAREDRDAKRDHAKPKHRDSSFVVEDNDSEEGQHFLEKTLREASHKADTHDR